MPDARASPPFLTCRYLIVRFLVIGALIGGQDQESI